MKMMTIMEISSTTLERVEERKAGSDKRKIKALNLPETLLYNVIVNKEYPYV
jgi:hypothetical protein